MCEPIVFPGVTPERWNEIETEIVGRGLDVSAQEQADDAGDVTIAGADIAWVYDPSTQVLTVQCRKKPFFVPCGAINDRIKEAFTNGK